MTLQDFIKKTNAKKEYNVRPQIVCNDGFAMSVQASSFHYCVPRKDNAEQYTGLEIGYPSQEEPLLFEFAKDTDYTQTVYGCVHAEIIQAVIDKHGGINIEKTFKKQGNE